MLEDADESPDLTFGEDGDEAEQPSTLPAGTTTVSEDIKKTVFTELLKSYAKDVAGQKNSNVKMYAEICIPCPDHGIDSFHRNCTDLEVNQYAYDGGAPSRVVARALLVGLVGSASELASAPPKLKSCSCSQAKKGSTY